MPLEPPRRQPCGWRILRSFNCSYDKCWNMSNVIEYGIETHLRHSHKLPIQLGARSLHTKSRDNDPGICKMIASSFQNKHMSSRILGEAIGHGQARSSCPYDDKIIGCVQFCDRRRHGFCRSVKSTKDRGTGGSMRLSVVYDIAVKDTRILEVKTLST